MRGLLGMLYWNDTFWKKQTVWVNICLMIINRGAYLYGICFVKTSWIWYFQSLKMENFFLPLFAFICQPHQKSPPLKMNRASGLHAVDSTNSSSKAKLFQNGWSSKKHSNQPKVIFTFFSFIIVNVYFKLKK